VADAVDHGAPARPPIESRVRVRYADTDQMGIVYYANYFVWFEVGRTDWLRANGWTYREMEAEGLMLPVLEAHCTYRQPARYDEELLIRTTARPVSPLRLAFDYEVVRVAGPLVASGFTVHTTLDRRGKPVLVPERVRDLIS
jgi:acyl-CoA thioester hydrolase